MGFKASMIIIENPHNYNDDITILKAIAKNNYKFEKYTTLENCIYSRDKSICLGRYNGNIILTDDYQITTKTLEQAKDLTLTIEEKNLCNLFPLSEIVTLACHSVINYHGYSLIGNGIKTRLKLISSDTPLIEFGEKLEEEEKLYSASYAKYGANYWKNDTDPDEEYSEDQLMEEFTFAVASRRLGIYLNEAEGDELMEKIRFKKYTKTKKGIANRLAKVFAN